MNFEQIPLVENHQHALGNMYTSKQSMKHVEMKSKERTGKKKMDSNLVMKLKNCSTRQPSKIGI